MSAAEYEPSPAVFWPARAFLRRAFLRSLHGLSVAARHVEGEARGRFALGEGLGNRKAGRPECRGNQYRGTEGLEV